MKRLLAVSATAAAGLLGAVLALSAPAGGWGCANRPSPPSGRSADSSARITRSTAKAATATTAGARPAPPPAQAPPKPRPPRGKAPSRLEAVTLTSPALGVSKRLRVYIPRGYDDVVRPTAVVYLLHGLAGSEDD